MENVFLKTHWSNTRTLNSSDQELRWKCKSFAIFILEIIDLLLSNVHFRGSSHSTDRRHRHHRQQLQHSQLTDCRSVNLCSCAQPNWDGSQEMVWQFSPNHLINSMQIQFQLIRHTSTKDHRNYYCPFACAHWPHRQTAYFANYPTPRHLLWLESYGNGGEWSVRCWCRRWSQVPIVSCNHCSQESQWNRECNARLNWNEWCIRYKTNIRANNGRQRSVQCISFCSENASTIMGSKIRWESVLHKKYWAVNGVKAGLSGGEAQYSEVFSVMLW